METRVCKICESKTPLGQGVYNVKRQWVCKDCLTMFSNLHVDDFKINGEEVVRVEPYSTLDDKDQRFHCIDTINIIYNGNLSRAIYPQLKRLRDKGFTWIGILRAIEWFYVVKGNDIKRAKGGVGIVPYVYDDAQKYYEAANRVLEERYRNQIIPKINQNKKEVIKIEKQKREGLLDLGGL